MNLSQCIFIEKERLAKYTYSTKNFKYFEGVGLSICTLSNNVIIINNVFVICVDSITKLTLK